MKLVVLRNQATKNVKKNAVAKAAAFLPAVTSRLALRSWRRHTRKVKVPDSLLFVYGREQ
ncbi:hypothetical protein ACH42_02150 [Endozoicomonas sp. (ex Bugula neritina AB1)]|nr:hypothetical protein ACH42_02150 [Endozoicomonas sp. (ex Bugula neritina AB1)]